MARLGHNRWGKSQVRLSKVHRGRDVDDFSDITVQVLLEGEVEAGHISGDNSTVLPTDTMRNTVYALAQDHLDDDLEAFAARLAAHFVERPEIRRAHVSISQRHWERAGPTGFRGGGSERRTARVEAGEDGMVTWGGIEGLVVLKTTGSAFTGFPRDRFTTLAEADDRILATSISVTWRYASLPGDTAATWARARKAIMSGFFTRPSTSLQHQGWMMAEALLEEVTEIEEASFHLPNQHHLPFDLSRLGMEDRGVVFLPVSEPYGDIAFTVTR